MDEEEEVKVRVTCDSWVGGSTGVEFRIWTQEDFMVRDSGVD